MPNENIFSMSTCSQKPDVPPMTASPRGRYYIFFLPGFFWKSLFIIFYFDSSSTDLSFSLSDVCSFTILRCASCLAFLFYTLFKCMILCYVFLCFVCPIGYLFRWLSVMQWDDPVLCWMATCNLYFNERELGRTLQPCSWIGGSQL